MRYEGSIYRPPSEADSLIIQATIGCSHNRCLFCTLYKDKRFRVRPLAEILEDLHQARQRMGPAIRRIFLADGDALIMKTPDLLTLAREAKALFPGLQRLSLYGSPQSILLKSPRELADLKAAGYGLVYLGIESGSDAVLTAMHKGVDAAQMVEAGLRIREAGMGLSAMLILGLGGRALSEDHARQSARVVRAIGPEYLSLLTLMIEPGSPLALRRQEGTFAEPNPAEALQELRTLLEGLEGVRTVLRSNHASNYVSLSGQLPQDRERILAEIDRCLNAPSLRVSTSRRL